MCFINNKYNPLLIYLFNIFCIQATVLVFDIAHFLN